MKKRGFTPQGLGRPGNHEKREPRSAALKLQLQGFEPEFLERLGGMKKSSPLPTWDMKKHRAAIVAVEYARSKVEELRGQKGPPTGIVLDMVRVENTLKREASWFRPYLSGTNNRGGAPISQHDLFYFLPALVCCWRYKNPRGSIPWALFRSWLKEELDLDCSYPYRWWRDHITSLTREKHEGLPLVIQRQLESGACAWAKWRSRSPDYTAREDRRYIAAARGMFPSFYNEGSTSDAMWRRIAIVH